MNRSLTCLDVRSNHISGTGLRSVSGLFQQAAVLFAVDFRNNPDIPMDVAVALCQSLRNSSSSATLRFDELPSEHFASSGRQWNLGPPLAQQSRLVSYSCNVK